MEMLANTLILYWMALTMINLSQAMYIQDFGLNIPGAPCNQSFVEADEAPVLVDWNTIEGQCIGNHTMKIVWRDPEVRPQKIHHYLVNIRHKADNVMHCFRTKSTETSYRVELKTMMKIDEIAFMQGEQLYVQIETFPRDKRLKSKEVGIGSCPARGQWANWNTWSSCNCECKEDYDRCVGTKTRNRICLNNFNKHETFDYNCKPGRKNLNTNCIKNCSMLPATPITNLSKQTSHKENGMENKYLVSIMVGCFAFVAIVVFVLMYVRSKTKSNVIIVDEKPILNEQNRNPTVYFSYISKDQQKEEDLLHMIAALHEYGVQCVVDLLNTVEINNTGGLANWVPKSITNTDKIVVLLTKQYIKALNETEKSGEEITELMEDRVCKIHMEYKLITSMLYNTCQTSCKKVLLVLGKDVLKDEIPPLFRTMFNCPLPKRFDNKDDHFMALLGILLDTEPFQVS
ncbi:uncharacterized protein [Clytia hemisphaerica]|uniref:SEFIR domain-containing protein n=1 Tax=Clytia hemisphaerica TaxID=252671 RepID=A0A7M5WV47_9CNID